MSIHFISGKPGGGKSMYGTKLILEELVLGIRPVITNVPLHLGRLNEWIQEKYPAAYARRFESTGRTIADDVILLTEDDLAEFFTFRPDAVRVAPVDNAKWRAGVRPDFSVVRDTGVLYVLDEVHIAFNARAWAETGHQVLYYLSQHRKLSDDVICITQSVGNVDKQFRSVAQDFTYVKNIGKQKAGLFRLPAVFFRHTYAQPATENSKPMESGTFRLDVSGLASLYDTARGVGIHGRAAADVSHRPRGLDWRIAVVGIPLVLVLVYVYVPKALAKFVFSPHLPVRPVAGPSSAAVSPVVPTPAVSVPPVSVPSSGAVPGPVGERPIWPPPYVGLTPEITNSVVCTGFVVLGTDVTAYFSDGSTAYSSAGEIQQVKPHMVYAFGRQYRVVAGVSVSSEPKSEFEPSSPGVTQVPADDSAVYRPYSSVEILPSINSQASGLAPAPRLNGFSSLPVASSHFQSQQQSQF